MNETEQQYPEYPVVDFFPLTAPRDKQVRAMEYIQRKYEEGFRDIVIAAPTGIGKTGIGSSVCYWGSQLEIEGEPGGYYLVTQKLLQDQLERDFPKFKPSFLPGVSLKSATEYECPVHGNCGAGAVAPKNNQCNYRRIQQCAYMCQKADFMAATLSCTNYPYIFTERWNVGKLPKRKVVVLDECHSVERQILNFIELSLSEDVMSEWTGQVKSLPELPKLLDFTTWIRRVYLPILERKMADVCMAVEAEADPDSVRKKIKLSTHLGKIKMSVELIEKEPSNWVYWQETNKKEHLVSVAKPLDAAPFVPKLINELGTLRIYMSAFPGSKRVFARSLGIAPEKLAWFNLSSTFPIANRPILVMPLGSMGKKNIDVTLPSLLRISEKIFSAHPNEKGIVHCNSYKLGDAIYNHFIETAHGYRLLYPKNASEREKAYKDHLSSEEPTVIISPSMTEGFDFSEDLARWQIIAKVPYPYLGDLQVAAKKAADADWYDLQAVMSIIQACGRVCRSDTDRGTTYILDEDFLFLWNKQKDMFPRWWAEALVWPKRK